MTTNEEITQAAEKFQELPVAIALGAIPVPWRDFPEVISARYLRKQQAHTDYWAHREGCWYTGDPSTADGRGCEEHNRLYNAWQAAIC